MPDSGSGIRVNHPEPITIGGKTFRVDPFDVPGIATGSIYTALDALGTKWEIAVPKSGIVHTAWSFDSDNEQLDFSVHLFMKPFTGGTDHDAFAMVEGDRAFIAGPAILYDTFVGTSGAAWGGADNVGWSYVAPDRKLYGQVVTQDAPTYATGKGLTLGFTILEDVE